MKKIIFSLIFLIALGSLGANAYLYQKYSSKKPILRFDSGGGVTVKEYRDELEYRYGRQILRKLTLARIVGEAAKKAGVFPTKAELDERIADMERSAPEAFQTATFAADGEADLRRDLAVDLALENLGIQGVKLAEGEALAYYRKHPELFRLPRQAKVVMVVADTAVDAGAAARMLAHRETTEAAMAMEPGMHVVGLNGFLPRLDALPLALRTTLRQTALGLAPGAVARLEKENMHVVLRGEKQQQAGLIPFASAKARADRLARLAKARPRAETLAALYEKANVTFEMDYRDWFRDLTDRTLQTANAR